MSDEPYLYLTTKGWKTGRLHEIEIWFTASNGRYYVISEMGERSHWVQNLRREPEVAFRVGERSYRGSARVIVREDEPDLHAEVAALSEGKYGWSSELIVELAPAEELATG